MIITPRDNEGFYSIPAELLRNGFNLSGWQEVREDSYKSKAVDYDGKPFGEGLYKKINGKNAGIICSFKQDENGAWEGTDANKNLAGVLLSNGDKGISDWQKLSNFLNTSLA